MMSIRVLIFVVLCCQNAEILCNEYASKRQIVCLFNDTDCLTASGKGTFQEFATGKLKGTVPSDPIYVDLIKVDVPGLDLMLSTAKFAGVKSCTPDHIKMDVSNPDLPYIPFNYFIVCKHLTLGGQYKASGNLAAVQVKGEGNFKVNMYDYHIRFKGRYGQYYDKNNQLHFNITEYTFDTETDRSVVYDAENLSYGGLITGLPAVKLFNKNWKTVGKILSQPVLKPFIDIYIKNVINYITVAPINHVFSIYVDNEIC